MILRPTRRAFILRYFMYVYFFALSIFMIVFFNFEKVFNRENFYFIVIVWSILTLLPAIILSFKRRKVIVFIFPILLNVLGWVSTLFVYNKLLISENASFFNNIIIHILYNGPYYIFLFVSGISIFIFEIYRLSFRYEVDEDGIKIRFGVFSNNEISLPYETITEVHLSQNFFEKVLKIGNIITLTPTQIRTGNRRVNGGVVAGKDGTAVFYGGGTSEREVVEDPRDCIYGVPYPDKLYSQISEMHRNDLDK